MKSLMIPRALGMATVSLGIAISAQLHAQEFLNIRSNENWTNVEPSALKNLPLASGGKMRLSLGGDIRERWEGFRNENWGESEQKRSSSLLQRYMLHGDLKVGSNFRFFGQLKSGIETGRKEGPRPVDEDLLDVHEAWAEWRIPQPNDSQRFTVRVGRQEVEFGSGRLVSIREGPNVRLSFDGLKVRAVTKSWTVDAFSLRPHETNPGIFDNRPDSEQTLWGLYATNTMSGRGLDLYYLGLNRAHRDFDQGSGLERRHSFGARAFGSAEGWDYDYEAVWQSGFFSTRQAIRAWTIATNTGYTLDRAPLKPRIGFKGDIASGDRTPKDGKLGTFNALFPKGNYFSQADLLGPYNLIDMHPSLTLSLSEKVRVMADVDLFWRHSTGDGLYDVPGFVVVSGRGSRARQVGYGTNVNFQWEVSRNIGFEAEYQRFIPGKFLKDVGRSEIVTYVGLWITYRF